MSIPDFQSLMLPLLNLLADEQEYYIREIIETLAGEFNLTDAQKQKLLPSGSQPVFENRVGWAKTYLKKAGLVEYPRRAYVKITNRGLEVLQQNPRVINTKFLSQYPEFFEGPNPSNSIQTNWPTNDDREDDLLLDDDLLDDDLLDDDLLDDDLLDDDEFDSDSETYQFSAKLATRREELLNLVNKDGTQHTLLVEGEDNDVVITYLFREQKLVTVWNRSTALKVAEAIQCYFAE